MNVFMGLLLFFLTLSCNSSSCKKLQECVDKGSDLLDTDIIYDQKILSPKFELNKPLEMTKENARKVLSEALNVFGLAIIPTNIEKTIKVIEARDIRFHTDLPSYEATKANLPELDDTHDPIIVTYKLVEGANAEMISKNVESLLSRYGRVTPMRDGSIVLADLSSHAKKILPLIVKQDFPQTPEEEERLELEEKRAHEIEMARLKSGDMHEIGPHKHKGEDH